MMFRPKRSGRRRSEKDQVRPALLRRQQALGGSPGRLDFVPCGPQGHGELADEHRLVFDDQQGSHGGILPLVGIWRIWARHGG